MLSTTLFYIFSIIIVLSCLGVVSSKNPVYSVLFLILAFINSAILFLFLNAEILAMLLIVVYVGAVAVLFLFVVMMLNVKNEEKNIKFQKYTPFTLLIVTVVFVEILYIFVSDDVILKNISLSENLSFKNNTGDCRFTPTLPAINFLLDKGYQIMTFDEKVSETDYNLFKGVKKCKSIQEAISNCHVLAFFAGHKEFHDITVNDMKKYLKAGAIIFDGRMFFSKTKIKSFKDAGFNFIGVGR